MELVPTPLRDEERGVTPVIGIVLLVGVTVILMAGIGAAVIGFDAFQTTPQADLVYEQDGNEITIGVKSATGLTGEDTHIQIQSGEHCGTWNDDELNGESGTIESGDVASIEDDPDDYCEFNEGDIVQVIGSDTLVSTYEVR